MTVSFFQSAFPQPARLKVPTAAVFCSIFAEKAHTCRLDVADRRFNKYKSFPRYERIKKKFFVLSSSQIPTENNGLCYYHQTFGDKTKECRVSCSFSLLTSLLTTYKLAAIERSRSFSFLGARRSLQRYCRVHTPYYRIN